MLDFVFAEVAPLFNELLLSLAGFVALWMTRKAAELLNVKVEEKHLVTLHEAARSGVEAAMDKGMDADDLIAAAEEHIRASVGDAIKRLKPSPEVLRNIVVRKWRELRRDAAAKINA